MPKYKVIPIAAVIAPPAPVRVAMDETKLDELAASIRLQGVLQPLIVVPEGENYRIVAGHRRFRASCMAGLCELPCMVYQTGALAEQAAMLAENVCREDLTPAEEGFFFAEYCEKHAPLEADLPRVFGQSLSYIYDRMAFVKGYADVVQANAERKINFAVAKQLLQVTDAEHRAFLLDAAIEGGATARVVLGWVVDWKKSKTYRSAEAPGEPVAVSAAALPQAPLGCIFCGSVHDVGNLVSVPIHSYEVETLRGILRKLGVLAEAREG
jgi:ParB family transcriptional regulator, chromosome partitioning protein